MTNVAEMRELDIDLVYKELLDLEGLALLIRERGENASDELLSHFAERLNRLNGLFDSSEGITENKLIVDGGDDAAAAVADVAVNVDDESECAEDAESYEEIAKSAEYEEEEDADLEPVASPDVVRVEDVLSRQSSHDLRRSFTINDRFRFKRELFGNNDNDFADALNLVSAMNSLSEAEDYFYEDLGWDASNEEVKEFIAIVSRHFNNKK